MNNVAEILPLGYQITGQWFDEKNPSHGIEFPPQSAAITPRYPSGLAVELL